MALNAAIDAGFDPVPIYIHAPQEEAPWIPGAASLWWLHHSLAALNQQLRTCGSSLCIRKGDSATELQRAISQSGAQAVFWSRLYEPSLVRRDTGIKAALIEMGINARSLSGHLISEPWQIKNGSDQAYRVFTPYWRNASAQMSIAAPLRPPRQLPASPLTGTELDALALLPAIGWDSGFYPHWTPGETGATLALDRFIEDALEDYAVGRNRPDRTGTSRLSPHLHFGEISPRQILHRLYATSTPGLRALAAPFVRELGWRDFSHQLLFHFPHTSQEALQPHFARFPWAEVDDAAMRAWQRGHTGIPIVDAGMRELWTSGWMHNRVRMIVASFLTKNLRYHWLEGARWFWDTLVDADLANNTQGWQWSAGSGADAAPYFRIFNPVTQGERFDPNGDYVKRYIPELSSLPPKIIHQPWLAGGVRSYPKPIVDLKQSRQQALDAYAHMRGRSPGSKSSLDG